LQTVARNRKSNSSHRRFKTYVANNPEQENLKFKETLDLLKVYANIIATVNQIDPGTITGMIYKSDLRTYDEVLFALEAIFGPILNPPH